MFTRLSTSLILSLLVFSSAYAHDSARIYELEKELLEMKKRVSRLESILLEEGARAEQQVMEAKEANEVTGAAIGTEATGATEAVEATQAAGAKEIPEAKESKEVKEVRTKKSSEVTNDDGWRNIDNWKALSEGMGTIKVLEILGEPQKVKGASVSKWYYENGGILVFWDGYLQSWTEPE